MAIDCRGIDDIIEWIFVGDVFATPGAMTEAKAESRRKSGISELVGDLGFPAFDEIWRLSLDIKASFDRTAWLVLVAVGPLQGTIKLFARVGNKSVAVAAML